MAFPGRGTLRSIWQASKLYLAALYFATQDSRTPRLARWLAAGVLAYALSPIDLIPDFIPVLGQIDDLLLVPLGIWLVLRLIPGPVWRDARSRAEKFELALLPRSRRAAVVIIALWMAGAALLLWWLFGRLGRDG